MAGGFIFNILATIIFAYVEFFYHPYRLKGLWSGWPPLVFILFLSAIIPTIPGAYFNPNVEHDVAS
ncbi:hypothetical protein BDN72DRAFT_839630 [Pluteus cervinus]|uniref:Uncharacterized protein n=1 Tax=Pluteus cervinus TaxID=181527 RepID=A0ACD3AWT1_9AGAR|nr:hypothetical protein BDN72DRAFT_839630 [Pluteus cervinus]